MNILIKHNSYKLLLISLVGTIFILYTDIVCMPWILNFLKGAERQTYLWLMAFRSCYFFALIFVLIKVNLHKINTPFFMKRLFYNVLLCLVAYGICVGLSLLCDPKAKHFGSILLFQFFVVCILSALLGHIYHLYSIQRKKEQEIEQLKVENLQSRCDALANQINPHFFFNSLNGLSALIRKKNDVGLGA